jgi:hypothetical protein
MTTRTRTRTGNPTLQDASRPWLIAAVLVTAAVSLLLLFLPIMTVSSGSGQSGVDGTGQSSGSGQSRVSLAEQQGFRSALVVAVPVLVCVAPLLFPRGRRRVPTAVAAGVLGVAAVLGIASIGMFYLPSVALLAVAAIKAGPTRDRRT